MVGFVYHPLVPSVQAPQILKFAPIWRKFAAETTPLFYDHIALFAVRGL